MIARMPDLRWPTAREWLGGLAVAALVALAFLAGSRAVPAGTQMVTRVVTAQAIAKQEPPAKPGLVHKVLYREVQPKRLQVAPGAGKALLAAVCDTSANVKDSAKTLPTAPANESKPALAYAWRIEPTWLPWRDKVRLFTVGPAGEAIMDYEVNVPAEGRQVPTVVVREARVPVKRIVSVGVIAAVAGLVGHALK